MSEVKPLDIYGFIGRLADKERISNMAEQEKSIVDTGTGIPELDSIMNAYSRASRGVHDTEWWGEEEWEPIAEAFTKAREAWNKRTQPNLLERVREFAREIIELAHEGDVDSWQVYEIGTRTGVIRIEEKTVPCVPDDETCEACCACAEHAEHGEVVDCYRLNPELFPAELTELQQPKCDYCGAIATTTRNGHPDIPTCERHVNAVIR